MNEKYKMFKQFMHNELGITKEDIREWVKEAVHEEARKMIGKTYDDFDVRKEIRELVRTPYSDLRKSIVSAAAMEICRDVKVVINREEATKEPPKSNISNIK